MKYALPFLMLCACASTLPDLPAVQDDTCGANQRAHLIGRDATALERVLILGMVRVIRPDDMVTMDFREDRINFKIDAQEKIVAITCG
ncbi:Peptidase inhibitor I78 family protein [Yoonia tamlensis]|uniref:Peptidase inhibitor I78 family protein n=1 Tax=Yoonia tamlensis TaxID=390270 RepID=A0A1I6HXI4_9RHOB|nr:I78 family peptidase inhibitor [Yoonia tamlensis]SFR59134.1 Peptidase inhibitor I78 family protein [Yoonia tamlensis]